MATVLELGYVPISLGWLGRQGRLHEEPFVAQPVRLHDEGRRNVMRYMTNLFRLDRVRKLRRKGDVCYRYVVEHEVEPERPLRHPLAHEPRYLSVARVIQRTFDGTVQRRRTNHFALRDKLARVELRDDALQNLVDYRRQHTLVIVTPQLAEYRGQGLSVRTGQHTTCDVDHLKI
jgi:hypothetical protein